MDTHTTFSIFAKNVIIALLSGKSSVPVHFFDGFLAISPEIL
jgi:hypothetical protein